MSSFKVGFASDHAGYALKEAMKSELAQMGAQVTDFGCDSTQSCDYPDYAHPLARAVAEHVVDYGVAICSTGNGIAMTCNHHAGVRAALCWDTPLADFARRHNNANILAMPANFISEDKAKEIVHTFFQTDFEGGRHERRILKIDC